MSDKRLGIVVGGGPAPGINAVIGAATIEAVNQGFEVVGLYDGFKWVSSKSFVPEMHTTPLDIARVARIHFDGGSLLRTSRTSLMDDATVVEGGAVKPNSDKVDRVRKNLSELGINDLITIGGDDTALSSRFVAESAGGTLRTVHVPKTIDNDLPLPHDVPTFGFSTARYNGAMIVKNLMQDSLTTGRWYLVTVMGRTAGWLALSIGQSASATVTLIPEEFRGKTTIRDIADVLEGAMLKRRAMGRPDGVAIVAEGLANRLGDRDELEAILGKELPVDAAGHIRLSEIPLGMLLRKELESRFAARGDKISMVTHVLGYELRSADPTPADMAYCRSLGHGCIRLLLAQRDEPVQGEMVTLVNGNLVSMSFQDMVDPKTNRIRVRTVDTKSDQYRVARAYMIRLEQKDLDDAEMLGNLALHAGMTPEAFRERYGRAATRLADVLSN